MSTTRAPLRLTAALVLALPLLVDASPLPSYRGYAHAIDYLHPEATSQGTTGAPMSYAAALSGSYATSISGSAHGGSVDAAATSAAGSNAGADTQVHYFVDLVGPAGVYVPVRVTGFGYVEGLILGSRPTMQATASMVVNFDNPGPFTQLIGTATLDLTGGRRDFGIDEVVMVYAGRSFEVLLDASAGSYGLEGDPSYAHAYVDPTFTIDPAFASLYRLEGIPGADVVDPPPPPPPTSGVPEPGTVALVFIGLGIATLRRRRTRHQPSGPAPSAA